MKVLVIDDDPRIQRALRGGLERNRYRVMLAATGEDGLDEVALHPPALVIFDPAMPGMADFEVCRQLRQWGRAPIIALSGRVGEAAKIRALDMRADEEGDGRVHIANVRGKIEPDPGRPQCLLPEPRVGYRFHTGSRPEVLPLFHQLHKESPAPGRAAGDTE